MELTQSLIAAKDGALAEHERFLAIGQRGLCLPEAQLSAWLREPRCWSPAGPDASAPPLAAS